MISHSIFQSLSMTVTHFETAIIAVLAYMAIRLIAKLYSRWRELRIWDTLLGMYAGFAAFMAGDPGRHFHPPPEDSEDDSDEPSYETGTAGARIITISSTSENESDTDEEASAPSQEEEIKTGSNVPHEIEKDSEKKAPALEEMRRVRDSFYKQGEICQASLEGFECMDITCTAYHKFKKTLREFGKAPPGLRRRIRCHDECGDESCRHWHPRDICRGSTQLCDEWHQNDQCRIWTPKRNNVIKPGFFKSVDQIICTKEMCLDPQCHKYHWSGQWISTSNPPGKAPFLQKKECCDDKLWTGQACRDPTCGLRHKYARPNVGIPMDPFWNIDTVMNPPSVRVEKIPRLSPRGQRDSGDQPLWHILDEEGKPLCSGKEQPDGSMKPTPTYEEPRSILKSILKSYNKDPVLNGTTDEEKTAVHEANSEHLLARPACPEKRRKTIIVEASTFVCPGSEACGSRHKWSPRTSSPRIGGTKTLNKAHVNSKPKPTTSKSRKSQKTGNKKAGKPARGSSVSQTSKGGRPPTKEREELHKHKLQKLNMRIKRN